MNYNINSSGIYDVSSYNLISNNATIPSSLNVAGNLIGSGTALSNLNYTSIINPPNLSVYASNTNLNSLSSYSYLNRNTINSNLNSLSSYSYLNISGTNANLNSLSSYSD